jgi:hypothetical protein
MERNAEGISLASDEGAGCAWATRSALIRLGQQADGASRGRRGGNTSVTSD